MRLWSVHPRYLDPQGLTACWREGLLARKVLAGETLGYRNHPQLARFRSTDDPLASIDAFLSVIVDEARSRGYNYDVSKIVYTRCQPLIAVTTGQLEYETIHLRAKLDRRNPAFADRLDTAPIEHHPLFIPVPGPVEEWEII